MTFLLSLGLCVLSLASQQSPIVVTGRVVGGDPPVPLVGVQIGSNDVTVTTDPDGRFTLSLPSTIGPTARLTFTAPGYIDAQADAAITDGRGEVSITLQRNPAYREDITVSAPAAEAAAPPSLVIAPTTVSSVAGALDNVFRVLQTMPGVSATDDFGSRISVRGGGPDENLTVMDGVEIHDPYRLFGLTSAFNPETIEQFELTAGGFDASHGDRLSSILLVDNRAGASSKRIGGSAALSITDANVVAEGKLPSGSWLVTGRRTYYDLVAARVTNTKLPSFEDVQTKLAWTPGHGRQVTFFGLRSRESTDALFDRASTGDRFGLKDSSHNDVAAVTLVSPIGARSTSRTIAAWYRYADDLSADASVRSEAIRSNAPGDDAFAHASFGFARELIVRDVSVRQELTFASTRRQTIIAGAEFHALRTSWISTISGERNPVEANGSSVQGGPGLPSQLDSTADSSRAAAWVEDSVEVTPRLRVTAGARLDWSRLAHQTVVAPRLRATFTVADRTKLRFATGLYTQSPGYEKLLQADYFVDLSNASSIGLTSERSVHAIGGLEHVFRSAVTGRVEAYYKRFDRMIAGRLETPEETARRVAEYAFPANLASSVPTGPQITTIPGNLGSGRAYGLDMYVEKRSASAADRLTGWVSYTLGKTTIDDYGMTYPFDYDRRHSLSVVSTLRLSNRLSFGSTLRVSSGFPYTPPVGVRVASTAAPGAVEGAPGSLVPRRDANGLLMWTADFGGTSNLNSARLPAYARLDVRLTYQRSAAGRWQLYFELLNALGRKNAGTLTPRLEYDPSSDRPIIRLMRDEGLPRLPTVGFRIRF